MITGGAGGLGTAFARHIVGRGGNVVVADLLDDEGKQLADELGAQARYTHLDVTNPEQWSAAVQFTLNEFGSLSGLVNNAGVSTGQYIEHEPPAHATELIEAGSPGGADRLSGRGGGQLGAVALQPPFLILAFAVERGGENDLRSGRPNAAKSGCGGGQHPRGAPGERLEAAEHERSNVGGSVSAHGCRRG